jgi:hypothetical protein
MFRWLFKAFLFILGLCLLPFGVIPGLFAWLLMVLLMKKKEVIVIKGS